MQQIHGINLLQRLPATLNQEEIHQEERREVTPRKHISISEINIASDERREERQHEIPEPIRTRRERHADSSIPIGKHLRNASPNEGTPRHGKTDDKQTSENDHDRPCCLRSRGFGYCAFEDELAYRREDQETHALPEGANVEGFTATAAAREPDAEECGADVDAAEDHGRDVGVI
mgnify:CR=1 FL=1